MKKRETNNAENWSHNNDYPIGEAWNTDNTLAQLIVPRLLAFKALDKHGYPPEFDDVRKWNNTIQNLSVAKPQQLRDSCLCYCKNTNFEANHNNCFSAISSDDVNYTPAKIVQAERKSKFI